VAVVVSFAAGGGCGLLWPNGTSPASFVETIVNLPLVLPPVVTGYLLLVIFGRKDCWAAF